MHKLAMQAATAAVAVLVLALPAAAQQDQQHDAHHPGDTLAQAAPSAAPPSSDQDTSRPGTGGAGSQGMIGPGGMMGPGGGMMGRGAGMMGAMPGMMMRRDGMAGVPMSVTINIGPGIRVDAEPEGDRIGGPGMMGRGAMGMMAGRGAMMDGPMAVRHLQRVEGQLAYFRTELGVTEAQMPQWNSFANAVRAATDRLRQTHAQATQAVAGQPVPASQQLEQRIGLLSAQLDAMRSVAAAMEPLYAALSEEQKRAADALMAEHLRDMQRAGL